LDSVHSRLLAPPQRQPPASSTAVHARARPAMARRYYCRGHIGRQDLGFGDFHGFHFQRRGCLLAAVLASLA